MYAQRESSVQSQGGVDSGKKKWGGGEVNAGRNQKYFPGVGGGEAVQVCRRLREMEVKKPRK